MLVAGVLHMIPLLSNLYWTESVQDWPAPEHSGPSLQDTMEILFEDKQWRHLFPGMNCHASLNTPLIGENKCTIKINLLFRLVCCVQSV